jgi:hypothetical protein
MRNHILFWIIVTSGLVRCAWNEDKYLGRWICAEDPNAILTINKIESAYYMEYQDIPGGYDYGDTVYFSFKRDALKLKSGRNIIWAADSGMLYYRGAYFKNYK